MSTLIFDRDREWSDLSDFVSSEHLGLRLAIVSGRRRQGKSHLLRRLTRAAGGLYHQAQEVGRTQALARFSDDLGLGFGLGRGKLHFDDWDSALRSALTYPARGSDDRPVNQPSGPRPLLVIDELPYLIEHSPEIPSILQELYDESRDEIDRYPAAAVIICGSALSVMADLLSGTKALRGRAQIDMTLRPFDYLQARDYWHIPDPAVAFQIDAVLGGTPGYEALIDAPPPPDEKALPWWFAGSVLNPAHALFGESGYLLREDPTIRDKSLYNSILIAVAGGQHTVKGIGGVIGRDHNALRHPLAVLQSAGFLNRVEDMLTQKRPLFFIADPIIRFAEVVIEPFRALLEERADVAAWSAAAPAYSSQVLGPHFEHIAVTWTARYSGERWGQPVGEVGPAVVNDPAGRSQHQLDVLAFARGRRRQDPKAPIVMIGEAKATNQHRTLADLQRLEHLRDLLAAREWDVTRTHLALFSREGWDESLAEAGANRTDVHLIDLKTLYQRPS